MHDFSDSIDTRRGKKVWVAGSTLGDHIQSNKLDGKGEGEYKTNNGGLGQLKEITFGRGRGAGRLSKAWGWGRVERESIVRTEHLCLMRYICGGEVGEGEREREGGAGGKKESKARSDMRDSEDKVRAKIEGTEGNGGQKGRDGAVSVRGRAMAGTSSLFFRGRDPGSGRAKWERRNGSRRVSSNGTATGSAVSLEWWRPGGCETGRRPSSSTSWTLSARSSWRPK